MKLKSVPVVGQPILSARVSNSDSVFSDIVRLYFHSGWTVADMTYGNGVFWKTADASDLVVVKSDIACLDGINLRADAGNLPFDNGSLDAIVFDPPYLYVGGLSTLKESINRGYRTRQRGFAGVEAVDQMYFDVLDQGRRVLRKNGLVVLKHMAQVYSGLVRHGPVVVHNYAVSNGYSLLDWMINVVPSTPALRWKHQKHSRRNYSDWLILVMKGEF